MGSEGWGVRGGSEGWGVRVFLHFLEFFFFHFLDFSFS